MKISVIIPCYNAADKIGRCLASLRAIDLKKSDYEVLFIDDCSLDGTYVLLCQEAQSEPHWAAYQLEKNSGSPSQPRNLGIQKAKGKYVYFLDCDDEILPDALTQLHTAAEAASADIVRSALVTFAGREKEPMNFIPDWNSDMPRREKIAAIIKSQSTVANSFIKSSVLREHAIEWPVNLRMGEDTVFLSTVLVSARNIEYIDIVTFIYNKLPSLTPASTRTYGRRELLDHLTVWRTAQDLLAQEGISYIEIRLHIGLRVALECLIFRSRGNLDEAIFQDFSQYINEHWETIRHFSYTARLKEFLLAIQAGDYTTFLRLARPRLLIAGHDLKFILDATSDLEKHFDIRIDEWKGHAIHDEAASRTHLEWAEYIWCEWLLGNAEWYSWNKKKHQRLVIRMHRMELERTHGDRLNIEAVDAVVAVSTLFFERLLECFPNIPREKARLVHNYVRTEEYDRTWHDDQLFTISMIGILPSRKGFLRGLEILHRLRQEDSRFRLEIFGKRPEELSWIARNPEEMAYFQKCNDFIQSNGLTDAVRFNGHVDVKTALAKYIVGYVLSVSDPDDGIPGGESFHLAVADGIASGGVGLVIKWPGAEFIWPKEIIVDNQTELYQTINRLKSDKKSFTNLSTLGIELMEKNYSISNFIIESLHIFDDLN